MAKHGPKPEKIIVEGRLMTKRQAAQWLGMSQPGLQYRLDKGLPLTEKSTAAAPVAKKPKTETIEEIRNRYADEVHKADQQPGSVLSARDVALAAFDYAWNLATKGKKKAAPKKAAPSPTSAQGTAQ